MYEKKIILALVLAIFLLASTVTPVSAEGANNISIVVDNQIACKSILITYNNSIMLVPAQELAASIGGTFSYDKTAMTGTVRQGENEVVFRLDDSIARLNGKYIQAPAPMKISGMRFMVPALFTMDKLGVQAYMNLNKNLLLLFKGSKGKLVYQVVSGDTLWIISQLFNIPISTIRSNNNLTGDMLYIGQLLIIKDFVPPANSIAAYITRSATIKSGAGFNYSDVNYLGASTNITVTGKNGDWYKAITPKGNGYIHYSVVGIKQELSDTAPDSQYFNGQIPIDTSMDYVTYTSYIVQSGDSIWSVSQKVAVPDYELAAANNMSPEADLKVSQVLKVPVHNIPVKAVSGLAYGEVLDWFKEAQYVFPIGKIGKLTDVQTGKSFNAKRTMGANHSDTEPLTAADTQIMKDIFGGQWTWLTRPFILEVDGRRIAVSISGMAHAGVDGVPYLQNVDNRSGNFGYGPNDDTIAGNGMDGHFDLYFLNCLRHVDNKIDPLHQNTVMLAGGLR